MIDYNKINDLRDKIKVLKAKLSVEDDFNKRNKLTREIRITELKIKIEELQ